jgi:Spy/CpxP family protein refolding chaperone
VESETGTREGFDLSMKTERKKAALFVALVFVCGALAGALGVNLWDRVRVSADAPAAVTATGERVPPTTRKRAVKWFSEELQLGTEQADQLARILEETRASYKEHEREIDEVRHEAHNRIRHILNDQQREKFNQLLAQRKAQREARQKQLK